MRMHSRCSWGQCVHYPLLCSLRWLARNCPWQIVWFECQENCCPIFWGWKAFILFWPIGRRWQGTSADLSSLLDDLSPVHLMEWSKTHWSKTENAQTKLEPDKGLLSYITKKEICFSFGTIFDKIRMAQALNVELSEKFLQSDQTWPFNEKKNSWAEDSRCFSAPTYISGEMETECGRPRMSTEHFKHVLISARGKM